MGVTLSPKEALTFTFCALMSFNASRKLLPPFAFNCWSAGPRRPSNQSDAIVTGFLYMFVSIFLCLVSGVRPRFHNVWSRPLCNCLVKKINQGTNVLTHQHTELPASSLSIMCSQAHMYETNYIDRQ